MNICHKLSEIGIVCDGLAFEVLFEETAGAIIGFVEGFGIGVEEVREVAIGWFETFQVFKTWKVCFNANQKMKVIRQKAVRESIHNWRNILVIKLQKIIIIPFFDEDRLAVIAAVVNMIEDTRFERWLCHKSLLLIS